MNELDKEWTGDERRESTRRIPPDRRSTERRKKYFFNIIVPTVIAVVGAGLVSWGAYVTHVTYAISAKFDSSYASHVAIQNEHDQEDKDERMAMRIDYNSKIIKLRETMDAGFKEMRESNRTIYNLIVRSKFDREWDSSDDEQ